MPDLCRYCHAKPPKKKTGLYCCKAHSNASRKKSLYDRLDALCIPGQPEECWAFTGCRDRDGYGVITGDDRRHQLRVSRLIYERAYGPVPHGLHVLHTCDNPPCWNPAHLRLGTNRDNINDKVSKGRQARGAAIGRQRLTEEDVRAIRNSLAYGVPLVELAKRYSVTDGAIWMIQHGRTWKHVK